LALSGRPRQDQAMTLAVLAGLGTGALHALAGPDHLLSLAPMSVGRGRGAWRVGLRWGVGHSVGTLLVLAAVALAAHHVGALVSEEAGQRLAGVALLVTGALALWRRRRAAAAAAPAPGGGPALLVGLVHGLAGGAAVLLLLPGAAAGGAAAAGYLGGFVAGSTFAMAGMTAALALASTAAARTRLPVLASTASGVGSVVLGLAWTLG
jgi:hypothetical protein